MARLRADAEAKGTMDMLEWASTGAKYLYDFRARREEDFRRGQEENRGWRGDTPRGDWIGTPKSIAGTLYHFTLETFGDPEIPGRRLIPLSQVARYVV